MKKSKLFILAFCLLLTALFTVCISAATYSDLTYTVSNGKVTITGCNPSATGALTIPAEIDGYPVTSIGNYAFSESVVINSIEIPSSVTSIGRGAFSYNFYLNSIVVDAANQNYSSDTQGILYNKEKTILIFSGCGAIGNIEIPSSVTSIGDGAFAWCGNLKSIMIPSSVTSIGSGAFADCDRLMSVTFAEGSQCTSIGNGAFWGCSELTSITIPSSVMSIEESVFGECSSLTSFAIPTSVTSIGDSAFEYCSGLTSITIPSSVTNIGKRVFRECSNLTSITIWNANCSINNSGDTIPQGTIYGRTGSTAQTYANKYGRIFVVATCAHPAFETEWSVATPPTCTVEGSGTHICAICGDTVEGNIPALGHDYVLSMTAKAPTCTASGIGRYTCTRCEATKIDSIPATGHTEVEIPAVAATCTTDGLTAGVKCSVCDEILVAQEVVAGGHTEVEIPAVAATCTTDGATAGVRCSVCNAILTAPTVIPALGHSEVALAAVPASCTESGLTAGVKCSVCNEILVAQVVIPALGHDYQITETYLEASCTEAGIAAYTCTRCGDIKYDDIPKVSALSLSGVYTNGEGDLRFVTRVTSTAGDPEIEYFGTYIVPLSYFTENELTAGGGEQPGVAAVKYTQSIASGASFAADLDGIPGAYVDTPIFAWSFVKFQGIDAVYTQVLGSFTVSGARLVKGGF
ncbi:MAG: leucine-rich repeat domain-containing protein [Clostridia bacterium]|nr:leucine-rich repeat domain-containing protein [Clostridia bacterium]